MTMRAGACHAGTGQTNANAHVAGRTVKCPGVAGNTANPAVGTTREDNTAMSTDPPEYEPAEPDTLYDVMRCVVEAHLRQHRVACEPDCFGDLVTELMHAADAYACSDYDYLVAQLRDSLMARQA